jgi:hypothetical protein
MAVKYENELLDKYHGLIEFLADHPDVTARVIADEFGWNVCRVDRGLRMLGKHVKKNGPRWDESTRYFLKRRPKRKTEAAPIELRIVLVVENGKGEHPTLNIKSPAGAA